MSHLEMRVFEVILVLTVLVLIFIITRLFKTLKMVNTRVTILSRVVSDIRRKENRARIDEEAKGSESQPPKAEVKEKADTAKETEKNAPADEKDKRKVGVYAQAHNAEDAFKVDLSKFEELSEKLEKELKE